jgi:DNA-binding PucR family transcriptional regulator
MIFNLEKPIYGSFYAIWDKWLNFAKKNNYRLVVNTSHGTATFTDVKEYLKGAEKLKRFYKNPEEPMIFYGRDFLPLIKQREERKRWEKKLNTEGALLEVLKKIKEKKPELFKAVQEKLFVNTS